MIGAAFLFSGILGSATISLIMCKLMKLKFMVFLCIVVGSIAYIMAFIAFSDKNKVLMILFPAIMGFFLVPVRGLLIQCCCIFLGTLSKLLFKIIVQQQEMFLNMS